MHQLFRFRLRHALSRNPGPARHDLGNILFGDHISGLRLFLIPLRALFLNVCPQLPLLIPQAGRLFKILMRDRILLFNDQG